MSVRIIAVLEELHITDKTFTNDVYRVCNLSHKGDLMLLLIQDLLARKRIPQTHDVLTGERSNPTSADALAKIFTAVVNPKTSSRVSLIDQCNAALPKVVSKS